MHYVLDTNNPEFMEVHRGGGLNSFQILDQYYAQNFNCNICFSIGADERTITIITFSSIYQHSYKLFYFSRDGQQEESQGEN